MFDNTSPKPLETTRTVCLMLVLSMLAVLSCDKHHVALADKLNQVKELGNSSPDSALKVLDSLQDEVDASNEYLRHKSRLLAIRLKDKAYIPATSDHEIKRQVLYFEKHGTNEDRQEAFYYAGSVYRDLQDTPSALEYFLKSADCQDEGNIDSIMLRNTYSQLNSLYYDVQDYSNALDMARKETSVATNLGALDARTLLHEGSALMHLDSTCLAHETFRQVMALINQEETISGFSAEIVSLLHYFSMLKDMGNAEACYKMIKEERIPVQKDLFCNMGTFFLMENNIDSALHYYQKALDIGPTLFDKYNAARMLVIVHHQSGSKEKASQYAKRFVQINDSLNLGERQDRAATANNKYKYFKDKEEELTLKAEKERYRLFTAVISSLLVILLLAGFTAFYLVNNRKLKKLMTQDMELKNIRQINNSLKEELLKEEQELSGTKKLLDAQKQELQVMKAELDDTSKELQDTRQKLEKRVGVSQHLFKMLNKANLRKDDESIMTKLEEAGEGKYKMEEDDWKGLCYLIDKQFPTFHEDVIAHLGDKISDPKIHFCYLLKAGLTQPQIRLVLGMSKSTVWTWNEQCKWVIE